MTGSAIFLFSFLTDRPTDSEHAEDVPQGREKLSRPTFQTHLFNTPETAKVYDINQ